MLKQIVSAGVILLSVTSVAKADARTDLQQKLATYNNYSADFSQQVYDEQGERMQHAKGHMQLARPDRFRWHTQEPDESEIISNGQDVWMYDPFVEQVSIAPLSQAIENTPFMLIAGGDNSRWQHYDVTHQEGAYVVTSKDSSELVSEFSIRFDDNDRIQRFTVIESGGQRSEFNLRNINTEPQVSNHTFTFTPPNGVMVDDQR